MASELIELISNWEKFAAENKAPTVEEFCRKYLESNCGCDVKVEEATSLNADRDMMLIRTISRIAASFSLYTRCALQNTSLGNYEGFPFLNSLKFMGEVRKTDVINYNLTELSTGTDILSRLLKQELIEERQDPDDKRSKLVKLTAKGEEVWQECYKRVAIAASILFRDLPAETVSHLNKTLQPVESKHAELSVDCKGLCITEVERKVN
jgi:DNA-binding MarR family transcriptional regulator